MRPTLQLIGAKPQGGPLFAIGAFMVMYQNREFNSKKGIQMRIILALDGSDESLAAARLLSRLPLPAQTRVAVITAIVDTPMDEIDAEVWMQVREASRATALQNYQAVLPHLGQLSAKAEHLLLEGHPSRVILETAKEQDADLIVLGAHGHSLVARVLLGSTSDYVANRAACPVLVVRPPAEDRAAAPLRVLLAYDGSAGAKVAAEQLFSLEWTADTQLQITTLLERPHLLPEDQVYDSEAISESQQKLTALVTKFGYAANVSYDVRETQHVGDSLAHLADELDGDLIFIGETGRSALATFFLGSATRHVLRHSTRSVWIARRKNWL